MSLRDGSRKMSNSEPSDYSRINLTDDADAIAQKIRQSEKPIPSRCQAKRGPGAAPEADNLVGIYAALQGVSKNQVLTNSEAGNSRLQNALVDLAVAKLGPIGAGNEAAGATRYSSTKSWPTARRRAQAIAADT